MEIIKIKPPDKLLVSKQRGGGEELLKLQISAKKIITLKSQVQNIYDKYKQYENEFVFFPIYCKFNKLLGKTHRFSLLFLNSDLNRHKQIDSKYVFDEEGNVQDKIDLVYSCSLKDIKNAIADLQLLLDFVNNNLDTIKKLNDINSELFWSNELKKQKIREEKVKLIYKYRCKDKTLKLLNDINYLYSVEVPFIDLENNKNFIKFYDVDTLLNIRTILKNHNIILDDETIVSEKNKILNLDFELAKQIQIEIPFLISTAAINKIIFTDERFYNDYHNVISSKIVMPPNLEWHKTQIGVIDTHAVFKDGWEKYIDINNEDIIDGASDIEHGTGVCSIIMANDYINHYFKDGLGYFPVKHFGILGQEETYLSYIMSKIEEIILNHHKNIKIWNLSIDVRSEPYSGISEFGKFLDRIQKDYDILLVISCGNRNIVCPGSDSLSAISVGALYENNQGQLRVASYCGKNKIFNRFEKPNTYDIGNDLSALDAAEKLYVLNSDGYIDDGINGTSFAAPLVARKCAFLYEEYDLSIEAIRAIINLQSKLSETKNKVKRAVVDFAKLNDKSEKIIIFEGTISPKQTLYQDITLPHVNKKKGKYKDYHIAIATAYKINNNSNVGDEYSSVEINCKLISDNLIKSSSRVRSIKALNLEKETNNLSHHPVEKQLIEHFKKYDPNKVLIDAELFSNEYTKPFNTNTDTLKLVISCSDLFDDSDNTQIKYAVAIFIKAIDPNALDNFIKNNINIIDKVYNEVPIDQKIIIKNS